MTRNGFQLSVRTSTASQPAWPVACHLIQRQCSGMNQTLRCNGTASLRQEAFNAIAGKRQEVRNGVGDSRVAVTATIRGFHASGLIPATSAGQLPHKHALTCARPIKLRLHVLGRAGLVAEAGKDAPAHWGLCLPPVTTNLEATGNLRICAAGHASNPLAAGIGATKHAAP